MQRHSKRVRAEDVCEGMAFLIAQTRS